MATRNLTRIYINFRIASGNKGKQEFDFRGTRTKRAHGDDVVSLVSDDDVESGRGSEVAGVGLLPPEWTNAVEEVQYTVSKIQTRIKDLTAYHDKHLNRPSLDDSINEEHTIDITTQEITQMFHQCQRCIQSIQSKSRGTLKSEQIIIRNVVSSLASQVQDLSISFKKGQSTYLKRLKSREETERQYFDTGISPDLGASLHVDQDEHDEFHDKGFTTAQLQVVEDNEQVVLQREKEIQHITQSISDLNMIFKDLAVMVVDQGSILDRIDYNVEQASVQVEKGLEQLQKGEKHQKSSRKMMCILFLAVVLIIMLVVLVVLKSK